MGCISTVRAVDSWLSLIGPSSPGPVFLFGDNRPVTLDHIWGSGHPPRLSLGIAYLHQGDTTLPKWDPSQKQGHREQKSSLLDPPPCGWMSLGCQALLPDAFLGQPGQVSWWAMLHPHPSELCCTPSGLSWNCFVGLHIQGNH